MNIYRFDRETGKPIQQHGSNEAFITAIANLDSPTSIRCIHLQPNGLVGSHPAETKQLVLVVQGEGYLRGEGAMRTPIRAGQAVLWEEGEWHETSTDDGLIAIVIESPAPQPDKLLPEA